MRSGESIGLRAFNERLMISAIRQAGALSKAEIARTTGLSGQAATVIVNSLLDEGLLVKREKVRGRIGKPFTPIALNPEGAYSLGVKIGRRSLEVLLVDFCGDIVASRTIPYHAPFPSQTMTMAMDTALELVDSLKRSLRARIVGLGVAMPWVLHEWFDVLGLEREAIAAWREIDVAAELEAATGLSASLYNDATAACAAEMIAGDRISRRSALYIYLGTFVGGGVVIGGRLYRGRAAQCGRLGFDANRRYGSCRESAAAHSPGIGHRPGTGTGCRRFRRIGNVGPHRNTGSRGCVLYMAGTGSGGPVRRCGVGNERC